MRTILRIIVILLVAAIVARGFSLAVNGGTTSNSSTGQPGLTNATGQSFQPMERPDADRDSGSLAGGIGGVLGTLAKITGITILVLAVQKAFSLIGTRKLPLVS